MEDRTAPVFEKALPSPEASRLEHVEKFQSPLPRDDQSWGFPTACRRVGAMFSAERAASAVGSLRKAALA
jgi:hypothetical protein